MEGCCLPFPAACLGEFWKAVCILWRPCFVCLLLNCMKGLGGFVTHWNYSDQFFFLKDFLLNIWLHMFWKLHIMLMMLWRIQKYNKDSPSYLSMRLRIIIWIIHFMQLVLWKLYRIPFNLRSKKTETLKPLDVQNAISENMAKKISKSCLTYRAFSKNPKEGIRNLFT